MRRMSMATRDELIAALSGRYGAAGRIERTRILDEFVAVTGYHRKHAMRVLQSRPMGSRHGPRPSRRIVNRRRIGTPRIASSECLSENILNPVSRL